MTKPRFLPFRMYPEDLHEFCKFLKFVFLKLLPWHRRMACRLRWWLIAIANKMTFDYRELELDDPLVKLYNYCCEPAGSFDETEGVRDRFIEAKDKLVRYELSEEFDNLIDGFTRLISEDKALRSVNEIAHLAHSPSKHPPIAPSVPKVELIRLLTEDVEEWNRLRREYPNWNPDLSSDIPNTIRSFYDKNLVEELFPDIEVASVLGSGSDQRLLRLSKFHNFEVGLANLKGVNFSFTVMEGIDFSRANLDDCIFVGAHIRKCVFNKTRLDSVDFSYATISDCDFRNAHTGTGEYGDGAFLQLIESVMIRGFWMRILWFLQPATIALAFKRTLAFDMPRRILFRRSRLLSSSFQKSILRAADFQHADLRACDLSECDLIWSDFRYADFRQGTTFHKAELFHSIFTKASVLCLSRDAGIWSRNAKFIHVIDDLGTLRSSFSGVAGGLHSLAFVFFLLPYFFIVGSALVKHQWYSQSLTAVEGQLDVSRKLEIEKVPLYIVLYRGAKSHGLLLVAFTLMFNLIRILLVYKTKQLEKLQEVEGYVLDFQFSQNRLVFLAHKLVGILGYINYLVVAVHTYRFLTGEVITEVVIPNLPPSGQ